MTRIYKNWEKPNGEKTSCSRRCAMNWNKPLVRSQPDAVFRAMTRSE